MNLSQADLAIAVEPRPPVASLWPPLLALLILVIAAYSLSVTFAFINYDDPLYITENPNVSSGLSLTNLKWALVSSGEANLWGPLTYASHQLDVSVFGLNPAGHHAVNVFWHALATAFLFLASSKLTKSTFWSFFIALIWAIHPEKIQSVAWLSERKDVLSGAFFFASLYLFTLWKLRQAKSSALYLTSFLLFALALLAKPSVVPLPLILFLLFYLKPKRPLPSIRQALLPLTPYVGAALLVAAIALHFQSGGGLAEIGEKMSPFQRGANIVVSYVFYLQRFFWPSPAQLWFTPADVVFPLIRSLIFLVVVTPLVIWLGTKEKLITIGLAIYSILWLPISGLVPISEFFVADRYSYLPQVGLICVLVGLVKLLTRSFQSPVIATLTLGTLSAVLLFIQQFQLPVWKNSETLFAHEMSVNPHSLLAPIHYAEVFKESDPEKALVYYTRAHHIDPQAGIALGKMGVVQRELGRPQEALESFRKATLVNTIHTHNWTQLLDLQVVLGLYEQAEDTITRGIIHDPTSWGFIMNSGNYYLLVQKRADKALQYFIRAHELAPEDLRSIQSCMNCYQILGNEQSAAHFEQLLKAL